MTTSPVMTVTDELLAELEAKTEKFVGFGIRSDKVALLVTELRRLSAENAELAQDAWRLEELAKQANVNCRNAAYYLRKHRPDLATICSGWCDAIDTAMAIQ